jgi:hypothetical protein
MLPGRAEDLAPAAYAVVVPLPAVVGAVVVGGVVVGGVVVGGWVVGGVVVGG